MKIGVLGAGISGLSFARLAQNDFDVNLFEKKNIHGGIARTKNVEGIAYHTIGGHCFNSKFPEVMEFVFDKVLPKQNWHNIQREAVIKIKGHEINYPIEFAIQQIYEFDPDLALRITTDFLNAQDDYNYDNLEDWFRKKFGNTLAEKYFIPYNTKIWNRLPKEMSPSWVEGKLPIPNKESFFKGLISNEIDKMPHSSFYYPDTNNQNTFIDSLAKGLSINYNYSVNLLEYNKITQKWIINDEDEFDIIVSTLPLNILPSLIKNIPEDILDASAKLKYNRVTTMLWETQDTTHTWTYIPESENFFHRYIHIGSFFKPKKNYSITEVVGEKSYQEMVENGKKDPFLIRPIDYNVSEHAYVVFDDNYETETNKIKQYLKDNGIYPLGRFGEWQYYNMDVCIKSSMELVKVLKNIYS